MLRLVRGPAAGGDTIFADAAAAYDNLPVQVRIEIDDLRAVHDMTAAMGGFVPAEQLTRIQAEFPPVVHPVVRTHPETGRRTLFVNSVFTARIVGMEPERGEQLLQYLFRQLQAPEYQVRFRWTPDAVAFWDNRAVQHYAVSDYFPAERVTERVAIAGDRPVLNSRPRTAVPNKGVLMAAIAIQTEDLHKTYEAGGWQVRAVRGISLTVREGDCSACSAPTGRASRRPSAC